MTGAPGALQPADRLIVALDFEDGAEALRFCGGLEGRLRWVKVGLELFTAEGPAIVRDLTGRGLQVFLDLKLHDIPNTVERASARAAAIGASLVTVHAAGGVDMIRAAVRGAGSGPRVLAVTMLTSLTGDELPGFFAPASMGTRVSLLAAAAQEAGAAGVVASPRELRELRAGRGEDFILLAPGIRFEDDSAGDQKRVATPYSAIRDGADYIVIGRPITRSPDPAASFDRATDDMARAMGL
jgi:orotidine-5'-phosphate decarboxylase